MEALEQTRLLDIVPDAKDSEALAYIAGIIDADGHLGIHRVKNKGNTGYTCVAVVRMVERNAIDLVVQNFGGHVGCVHNSGGYKPIFQWRLYGSKAYNFIKAIKPWLRVKVIQADIILGFHEGYAFPRIGREKPQFAKRLAEEAILKLSDSGERQNRIDQNRTFELI